MGNHHKKEGTPGDILLALHPDDPVIEHHGIKGMKWGVRKERETTGRDGASKLDAASAQRMTVEMAVGGDPIGAHHGMTDAQKKAALTGLGVLAAAGGGYLAYSTFKGNTFFPGGKRPPEWDVSDLKHRPLSDVDLTKGGFSEKYPSQALKDTDFMTVDHSKGYADYTQIKDESVGSGESEFVAARHKDLTDTLDEMREKYPSVKNLKIEVVPMSSVPGMEGMQAMGAVAAVMPLGKGEARVLFNDTMHEFPADRAAVEAFVPGMFQEKYVGYHEMGHVLAVAHGDMPPLGDAQLKPPDFESAGGFVGFMKSNLKYNAGRNVYHNATFKKHGFSFKELSKLGGYAATQPVESMAELFGHYSHPEMRKRLTPQQLANAEKMFNEMGGVT